VTLTFNSFSSAAAEAAMSRIWGGIHFTFSSDAALQLGTGIGEWTIGAFNSGADTTPPKVTLNSPSGNATNHQPTVTGVVSSSFGCHRARCDFGHRSNGERAGQCGPKFFVRATGRDGWQRRRF